MAAQYLLRLTDADQALTVPMDFTNTNDAPETIRGLEILILRNLTRFAWRDAKEIEDSGYCLDILGQLDNLTDRCEGLILTAHDLDLLKRAYKALAGQRPTVWTLAVDFWKAFANPAKVEKHEAPPPNEPDNPAS